MNTIQTKEFELLLDTFECLLADPDTTREDFILAREQAFKHFYSIMDKALEEKDAQYKELLDVINEFPEIRDLIKLRKEKLIF